MVALPLALTATYEPPADMGEYAYVVVFLNGHPLMKIVSDDPVADTHLRVQQAITNAVERTARRIFRNDDDVEVFG